MAQPMPETVKVARARMSVSDTMNGEPFLMSLAHDEIAVLLSLYYFWYGTFAAGENIVQLGLWRKTDSDPSIMSRVHTDMLWLTSIQNNFVTESLESSGREHIVFPCPLVLIRAPRLVTIRAVVTSVTVDMTLYYLIRKVSDADLAKLMVKDHA